MSRSCITRASLTPHLRFTHAYAMRMQAMTASVWLSDSIDVLDELGLLILLQLKRVYNILFNLGKI
jgi:hypothetical protein